MEIEESANRNPMDVRVGYWLRRASARMMGDLLERLGELDLQVPPASVLLFISRNAGVTQSVIGRALGIQRANMAPIISSLEQRNWIVRAPFEGRSQPLSVSAEGAVAAGRVDEIIEEHERLCTLGISRAERLMLLEILPRVALGGG